MDLSSVRIAVGACAVFGGLALVGGGAVAHATPDSHSAAADSASDGAASSSARSGLGSARAGLGKAAPNGGASAVVNGSKSKPALDLTSIFGGSQAPVLPNSAAAVPNPAAAIPNPGAATTSTSSPTGPAAAGTEPGATTASEPGFGGISSQGTSAGSLGPVGRIVDQTWSVVDAVGNAIGSIVGGPATVPVINTPVDRSTVGGGPAVNGYLDTTRHAIGNPGASALGAGRLAFTPSLGYSQLPEVSGNTFTGPVPAAVLTPDLSSAADSANAGSPPVIAPIPVPGAKWLTDLPAQVREALRTASTAELLMGALPGLLGLVAFFVAGVGLGRRQAKFGFAMETTGIMRFAAKGPLGVVRGSFIEVHPKKTSAVRSQSARHLTLVDRVA